MLCRSCAAAVDIAGRAGVSNVDAPDLHALQRSLGRSAAKKQVVIGLGGIVLGIAVLVGTGSSGSIVVVPGGLLLGGIVALVRGVTGLAANPT